LADRCYRQAGRETGRQINVIDRQAGRQINVIDRQAGGQVDR
jgi:hypothetical protein